MTNPNAAWETAHLSAAIADARAEGRAAEREACAEIIEARARARRKAGFPQVALALDDAAAAIRSEGDQNA